MMTEEHGRNTREPEPWWIDKKVIVRSSSMGVFVGIASGELNRMRAPGAIVLAQCRRLWRWAGANHVSDLACTGAIWPDECRFSAPVAIHEIRDIGELALVIDAAFDQLMSVPAWEVSK